MHCIDRAIACGSCCRSPQRASADTEAGFLSLHASAKRCYAIPGWGTEDFRTAQAHQCSDKDYRHNDKNRLSLPGILDRFSKGEAQSSRYQQ